ncbi:MAG: endonuclease/exonuclease/phosphatase family protein [Silvanigrellales bacterium]|nr:endonuclease/exonuclease/phosphatase family protein [Silvanigrellales bacterium]
MNGSNTTLKVASLNTWHGLNGKGTFLFGLLEARSERVARLARQVNALKALDADVLLLQEVNPLPFRAHWYARQLHKRCEYVSCNAGVKLGWGPPWNLNEGLAILFPQNWKVEALGRKRLSGELRLSPLRLSQVGGPYLSLQLHESRVALALRLTLPPHRQHANSTGVTSVLLGVTHLHHAPALTPRNEAELEVMTSEGLSQEERLHVLKAFRTANARRVSEVDTLASWLERLRKPGEPILLGGDFNSEPESAPVRTLLRHGWSDVWKIAGHEEDPACAATWDPGRNPLAWASQKFHQVGGNFSSQVESLFRRVDALPRRIDYLFVYPPSGLDSVNPTSDLGCLGSLRNASRFGFLSGNPLASEGLGVHLDPTFAQRPERASLDSQENERFISDHFGVYAEFGANL